MRRTMESLNMYLLDYLIVPIWAVFSAFGNMRSAGIMIFVTVVFLILNYFSTRSTVKLFFLDMNLAAAAVAGIILNSFLYIRFIYADPQVVADMVTLIFAFTLFIILFCLLCLLVKSLMHRRNLRIINRMADEVYERPDDEYEDDDYYEDDEEDDDEDDEDYDEEEVEKRRGLIASIQGLLQSADDEDEEDEEEENDEAPAPEDDSERKSDEAKFRVIKK